MSRVRARELVAFADRHIGGTNASDWVDGHGPEMGPGEDLYFFNPKSGRKAFVNLDEDDVRVEVERDDERQPPVIISTTVSEMLQAPDLREFVDQAHTAAPAP